MDKTVASYFRCPYCGREGGHSQRVAKSVGLFRVKQLYNNVLIMECKKCGKVCRLRKVGATLKWQDMSPEEKKAFNKKQFVKYTKIQEEEDAA